MRTLLQAILIMGMLVTSFGASAQAQRASGLPSFQNLAPLSEMESMLEEMRTAQSPEARELLLIKILEEFGKRLAWRFVTRQITDFFECREACCKCETNRSDGESYEQCEADPNDAQSCEKCEQCGERWTYESLAGLPESIDPRQAHTRPGFTAEEADLLNRATREWIRLRAPTQ